MNRAILARLSGETMLVSEERASWFDTSLRELINDPKAGELIQATAANDDEEFWFKEDDWRAAYRPYKVVAGVLQIPVMGVLLNRFPYQFGSYATGYTYILRALQRGLEDANVRGIALIFDTPGGEVAGCFELGDAIFAARGQKPIRGFAADNAYSAGYLLISSVDPGGVTMTRSGGVGSIGVVTAHVDYSKAMDAAGVNITFIFAGEHKVDGNPYQALSAETKARIQARIDRAYGVFTSAVARNRGMPQEEVIATKALTFQAEEALEIGLADSEAVFEEAMTAFVDEVSTEPREDQMDKAEHDRLVAEAVATERARATAEANTAAAARVSAILESDAGKKRPAAALAALQTSMSAEDACAFLARLPEEGTAAAAPTQTPAPAPADPKATTGKTTAFDDAMKATGDGPKVGPDTATSDGVSDDEKAINALMGDYGAVTGRTPRKAA